MYRLRLFRVSVLLASLLLMAAPMARAQELREITFFMTFVPNVQFAPVYVALEKGYFAEEGLAVSIEHGDENVGVDLIAAGERQFGLISGEEVIKARGQGRPVVSIYEWFQRYPVGIVYRTGAGISTPTDLAGRKVGIPGRFGASYNGLIALLSANSMMESDIVLEPIGFNAPEVFCLGAVEASVVYINNEPLQIQNRIDASDCGDIAGIDVFPVAAAADMVSNGVVTNETTLAEEPELVHGFVRAWDRGLRDAIANPAETYLHSAAFVENLPLTPALQAALESAAAEQSAFLATEPDAEAITASRAQLLESLTAAFTPDELLQFRVLLNTIELWDAPDLGAATLESWQETAAVLLSMGALDAAVDVDKAFSNDYLPER